IGPPDAPDQCSLGAIIRQHIVCGQRDHGGSVLPSQILVAKTRSIAEEAIQATDSVVRTLPACTVIPARALQLPHPSGAMHQDRTRNLEVKKGRKSILRFRVRSLRGRPGMTGPPHGFGEFSPVTSSNCECLTRSRWAV